MDTDQRRTANEHELTRMIVEPVERRLACEADVVGTIEYCFLQSAVWTPFISGAGQAGRALRCPARGFPRGRL